MADQWYKFGAGFLLVYSITDRPTYDAIPGFHQDILRVKDRPYIPCVVVSNKASCQNLVLISNSPDPSSRGRSLAVICDRSSWDDWLNDVWCVDD